jgi:hypothetical protein
MPEWQSKQKQILHEKAIRRVLFCNGERIRIYFAPSIRV